MAEFLINATEIPYILMGGYGRLSAMFDEYRRLYGLNRRDDMEREDEILILFGYLLTARHNNTNLVTDPIYQSLISNLYNNFSINQYTTPITNGI